VTRVCSSAQCEQAGQPQPVDNFHLNKKNQVDGRCPRCKTCSDRESKERFAALDSQQQQVVRARRVLNVKRHRQKPENHAKILEHARKTSAVKRSTAEGKEKNRINVAIWRAQKQAEDPLKYARWDRRNKLRAKKSKNKLTVSDQEELTVLEQEFANKPKQVDMSGTTPDSKKAKVSSHHKANANDVTTGATQRRREWMQSFKTEEPDKFERFKRVQLIRKTKKKRTLTDEENDELGSLEVEFPRYWSYKISKREPKAYMRPTISS
jgi:hypothetical protein